MDVQIKGKRISKNKTRFSFQIERVDLEAFVGLHTTILYLVNFIRPNGASQYPTFYPHYVILSPFNLKRILDSMDTKQSSIAMKLKPLPDENDSLLRMVKYAAETQLESTELGFDPTFLERATELTVLSDEVLDITAPLALRHDSKNFTIVVTTPEGGRIAIPGEIDLIPPDYQPTPMSEVIGSGEIRYTSVIRRRVDRETVEFQLSPGLNLELSLKDGVVSGSGTWVLNENLEQTLRDLDFLAELWTHGTLFIADQEILMEIGESSEQSAMLDFRSSLGKISEVIRHFGGDPALVDIGAVTGEEQAQLIALHDTVRGLRPIPEAYSRGGRIRQGVGGWDMELVVLKKPRESASRLISLFDKDLSHHFAVTEADKIERDNYSIVTAFDILRSDQLEGILNLDLGNLVQAYEELSAYPTTNTYANHMVLALLHAADACTSATREERFLIAAADLNHWLICREGETQIHLINRWQIIYRQRPLSPDETLAIRKTKQVSSRSSDELSALVSLSCAILLNDRAEAEFLAGELKLETRRDLLSWPIANLLSGFKESKL